MKSFDLQRNEQDAIHEAIGWHTIAISIHLSSTKTPDWGTGVLIKINEKPFIVTCKHTVKPNYPDKSLKYVYRSFSQFRSFRNKEAAKQTPLYKAKKSYGQPIPVLRRFYSADEDDLSFIELDPSAKDIKRLRFYEIPLDSKTSAVDTTVFFMGFSTELSDLDTKNRILILRHSGLKGTIINKEIFTDTFTTKKHFLIDFPIKDTSVDPHGLSGCGIWTLSLSRQNTIWTPDLYLTGIQSAFFEESQALKATRIERLLNLFREGRDSP